jgi:hypothetical protein
MENTLLGCTMGCNYACCCFDDEHADGEKGQEVGSTHGKFETIG